MLFRADLAEGQEKVYAVAIFWVLAIRFLVLTLTILLLSKLLPGMQIKRLRTSFAIAAIYAMLNTIASKVLFVLTLPLLIFQGVAIGVMSVAVNALLLIITDKLLSNFKMSGFLTVLVAALGLSICNFFTPWF